MAIPKNIFFVLCFIDSEAPADLTETEASTQNRPEVTEPVDVQTDEALDRNTKEDNALRTEL